MKKLFIYSIFIAIVFTVLMSDVSAMTYNEFMESYPNEYIYRINFPTGHINYISSPEELEFELEPNDVAGNDFVIINPERVTYKRLTHGGSVVTCSDERITIWNRGEGFEGDIDIYIWSGYGFFFAFTLASGGENGGDDENDNDDSGFWNSVINGINSVVEGIKNVTSGILKGLKELLLSLFVPEEGYFFNKFEQIKIKFLDRVGIDTTGFDELKDVSAEDINGHFEATVFGFEKIKLVDLSFLEGFLSKFHDLVRGFIYPLLLFYNMDQVYFMIRGTHLFKRGDAGGDGE